MKTIYKQMSYLLLLIFLNSTGSWSNNQTVDDRNSIRFCNNNETNFSGFTYYGKSEIAAFSGFNIFAVPVKLYNVNADNYAFLHSFFLSPDRNTPASDINAYLPDPVKGKFTGCSVYKFKYKNGAILSDSKTRFTLYKYNEMGLPTDYIYYNDAGTNSDLETFQYDAKGNLTRQVRYFVNGAVSDLTTFKYDVSGNLTAEIWYEGKDFVLNKDAFRYDSRNNLIEEIRYKGLNVVIGKDFYKYNADGKVIECKVVDAEGIMSNLASYTYDQKGLLNEKKSYDSSNKLYSNCTYEYDASGNLTGELQIFTDGSLDKKDVYIYDSYGNKREHTASDAFGYVRDIFDRNGNKVETQMNYKGTYSGKIVYTYDYDDNLTAEVYYNPGNEAYNRTDYVFF
jgi:hypothetical protein